VVADTTKVKFVSPPSANCVGTACAAIQPAIDAANNGDLILVAPGRYQENLILYKPVKIQGWGAASTVIDNTLALANLPLKDAWNTKFQSLVTGANPWIDSVPGNANNFTFEQGAGIFVGACDPTQHGGVCANNNAFTSDPAALIDGLTLTGANESGGGIYVNGYAPYLQISNNQIYANQGNLAGGIRLGTPSLVNAAGTGFESSHNENTNIHRNRIAQNGSLSAGGGGISIYNGADHYQVTENMICGNLAASYGGGIAHFGLSDGGLIARNKIVSNESTDEGGGIMIAGELVPAGAPLGTLTPGSGSVTVDSNLIQGNKAGDDGGGLRTLLVNGEDVRLNPADQTKWWAIQVFNNLIVNNSSADHGGGISLDDTVKMTLINNTVSHNDSPSTGTGAFGGPCVAGNPPGQVCPIEAEGVGGLVNSIPRVGGIAAYAFSTGLQTALTAAGVTTTFSDPVFINNIIWHNRSFFWDASINGGFGGLLPITQANPPAPSPYWDLAVYNTATNQLMSPRNSILTDGTGATPDASNFIGTAPQFINPYFNLYEATSKGSAFGNFVTATFTPNGLRGDYRIFAASPAVDQGMPLTNPALAPYPQLTKDYDGDVRPNPSTGKVDIGADEFYASATAVPGVYRLGVFRNGQWFLELNGNGIWDGCGTDVCFPSFGIPSDIPVSGDWDGTGKTKIGVFRNGQWFLDLNGNGAWDGCGTDACYASFGMAGDIPVASDWNGTGIARIGVLRNGTWYLDLNGNGAWDGCGSLDGCYNFGQAGDKPVAGNW
jgi:large repetitive protein